MTKENEWQWWTITEVCAFLRCSKNYFHTSFKLRPDFPRPRKEGHRSVFYRSDQVRAYSEAQIDA